MKKFMAMLLSLALVLAMGTVAFAAPTIGEAEAPEAVEPYPAIEKSEGLVGTEFDELKNAVKADVDAVNAILAQTGVALGNAKANMATAQGAVKAAQAAVIGAMKSEIGAIQTAVKALVNAEVANAYETAYTELAAGVDAGLTELLAGLDAITQAEGFISSENFSVTGFTALADLYGTPLTDLFGGGEG